jgi:RHS repeat-associated protein
MFTGRQFDVETGLYYYRARYYNPYIGRFLQTDPVGYGAGMNLYRYCSNNPVGASDPSGSFPVLIKTEWNIIQALRALAMALKLAREAFDLLPEDWKDAAAMFSMWVRGEGPDTLILGPDSSFAGLLKDSPAVALCRLKFLAMNGGLPPEEWKPVSVSSKFGVVKALSETSGLHFLGSYSVTMTPGKDPFGPATITVTNTTK